MQRVTTIFRQLDDSPRHTLVKSFQLELGMTNFFFNKPTGACSACIGLGVVRKVIICSLMYENKSLIDYAIDSWIEFPMIRKSHIQKSSRSYYGFEFGPAKIIKDY